MPRNKTNKLLAKSIGSQIAAAMKLRDHTKSSLARAIGVSPSTVAWYVNGKGFPGVHMLLKIANSLNMDINNIVPPYLP